MAREEAARRCGNTVRAQEAPPDRTRTIVAENEWDWAMKRLGWVLGICFGVLFALAIIGG